jgi:hypothetical protein
MSRRTVDDADPEPHFVDRLSYELGRSRSQGNLRVADIKPAPEARIDDPVSRSFFRKEFPWLNLDGENDPAKYRAREEAIEESWASRSTPMDPEQRQRFEQKYLSGSENFPGP